MKMMRILLATDAFPPLCGGSGWSTYELARTLRARGHELVIVRPDFDKVSPVSSFVEPSRFDPFGNRTVDYDGFRPIAFQAWAPRVPFIRNYFKNERLYPRMAVFQTDVIRRHGIEIVHAQHALTGPSSILAAERDGIPVVCTVRDYWPVCYWSDLIYDRSIDRLCPECTPRNMTRCVRPHGGSFWPLAVPMIPYLRANLALKRRTLAAADAIVAVSTTIARDLRARAPELGATRIEMIPNPVDVHAIRAHADLTARPLAEPYALYAGKLEPNKGAGKLLAVADRARLDRPLVIVGEGSERGRLEAEACERGRDVRFTGWLPREEALAWLRHAELLIFPSHGPESLSRVLLEASALAVPIAAMDTGGTGDIIIDEETGLLSRTVEKLGDDVARLRGDASLRTRLGRAARRRVEETFDTSVVVDRVEALYEELVGRRR